MNLLKKLLQFPPKIKHKLPPIWEKIQEAGMNPNPENVVFAYGDTIYVPSGRELVDHVIAHEGVHCERKTEYEGCLDAWWNRYVDDAYFRIQEETEAYVVQYRFICKQTQDREQRNKFLIAFSSDLSGPMYGNIIGRGAAYRMIKDKANI